MDKLAKHLPFHWDQFFLRLQAAALGAYETKDSPTTSQDPDDEYDRKIARLRSKSAPLLRNLRRTIPK